MDGFDVKEAYLTFYGARIADLAGDASTARTYIEDHVHSLFGETGLFEHFGDAAQSVALALESGFSHLASIMHESGAELRSAGAMYQDIDDRQAAAMDATYEG